MSPVDSKGVECAGCGFARTRRTPLSLTRSTTALTIVSP
jgi:hypothetical protein